VRVRVRVRCSPSAPTSRCPWPSPPRASPLSSSPLTASPFPPLGRAEEGGEEEEGKVGGGGGGGVGVSAGGAITSASSAPAVPASPRRLRMQTDAETDATLDTCFALFSRETTISDLYECGGACGKFVPARQAVSVVRAPEVLVVVLKRFVRIDDYGTTEKLDTLVRFPLTGLDLRAWLARGDRDRDRGKGGAQKGMGVGAGDGGEDNQPPVVYDLMAVCHHIGTLNRGHYVAFAKQPTSGRWYKFNDDLVTPVIAKGADGEGGLADAADDDDDDEAGAGAGAGGGPVVVSYTQEQLEQLEKTLVTSRAYVLFYRKRGTGRDGGK
jgi:hypothetical protein